LNDETGRRLPTRLAERRRFDVGVDQLPRHSGSACLAIARNNELQAMLDYQLAVIAFEAVQQTGAA
jgi:hypothetical protein